MRGNKIVKRFICIICLSNGSNSAVWQPPWLPVVWWNLENSKTEAGEDGEDAAGCDAGPCFPHPQVLLWTLQNLEKEGVRHHLFISTNWWFVKIFQCTLGYYVSRKHKLNGLRCLFFACLPLPWKALLAGMSVSIKCKGWGLLIILLFQATTKAWKLWLSHLSQADNVCYSLATCSECSMSNIKYMCAAFTWLCGPKMYSDFFFPAFYSTINLHDPQYMLHASLTDLITRIILH